MKSWGRSNGLIINIISISFINFLLEGYKMNISKELLSAVLNEKVARITDTTNFNMLEYEISKQTIDTSNIAFRSINIYELSNKCKEWANNQGSYYLYSRPSFEGVGAICYISNDFYIDGHWNSDLWNTFKARTEPEAIFKSCEWVMEQNND